MSIRENQNTDYRDPEDTHRQMSRSTVNSDAIDCLINTNDLDMDSDLISHEPKQNKRSDASRRDASSKRSYDSSTHRSHRHSPPSVTSKRRSSPSPVPPSRSQYHHHHHHHSSQRDRRVSTPSPSPPSSSSRHNRTSKTAAAQKRAHSPSRSPHDRRAPPRNGRSHSSKEKRDDTIFATFSASDTTSKAKKIEKPTSNHEIEDLSIISEDESTKPSEPRSDHPTSTQDASSSVTNNQLHSTPSGSTTRAQQKNESVLDASATGPDYDLSLFINSTLNSVHNISSLSAPVSHSNGLLQAMDLLKKYKELIPSPTTNAAIVAAEKEIMSIIQKRIDLEKLALDNQERTIKLQQMELAEQEKRVQKQLLDAATTISVNQNIQPASETKQEEQIKQPEQSPNGKPVVEADTVVQTETIPEVAPANEPAPITQETNKPMENQPPVIRRAGGRSRFSKVVIDPSIFQSRSNPAVSLYLDENEDDQSASSMSKIQSVKSSTVSISANREATGSGIDAELKVISSSTCRKVEFQSGLQEKTSSPKGPAHDLRLTLNNNRSKSTNDDDDDDEKNDESAGSPNGKRLFNDDEQTITISKTYPSKSYSDKDDKQQSYDYHPQRNVTATEMINDNTIDGRHSRRYQQPRNNKPRQQQRDQQYSGTRSSSSTNNPQDRSYGQGAGSSHSSKYGPNQKRYETDDLRSRLHDQKHSKPSRAVNRNN